MGGLRVLVLDLELDLELDRARFRRRRVEGEIRMVAVEEGSGRDCLLGRDSIDRSSVGSVTGIVQIGRLPSTEIRSCSVFCFCCGLVLAWMAVYPYGALI